MAPRIDVSPPSHAALRAATSALRADLYPLRETNPDHRLSTWDEGLKGMRPSWLARAWRWAAGLFRGGPGGGEGTAGPAEPAGPTPAEIRSAIAYVLRDPRLKGLKEYIGQHPERFGETTLLINENASPVPGLLAAGDDHRPGAVPGAENGRAVRAGSDVEDDRTAGAEPSAEDDRAVRTERGAEDDRAVRAERDRAVRAAPAVRERRRSGTDAATARQRVTAAAGLRSVAGGDGGTRRPEPPPSPSHLSSTAPAIPLHRSRSIP
ncbi:MULTISPECIES: hypothetical protein [Catenuloplanes]|uniref:Uncharacterized protein n=1 Tax=Catenuloplanes niger TaxID=587534 RepID=A0AAE3ZJV3_9ACTN|nr:hypothetical protein [Catenuloplanes niger]MDR7320312.1 hypothetical protein [Catenuloplanes niger]